MPLLCTTKTNMMHLHLKITFIISLIIFSSCGDGGQNPEETKPESQTQISIENQGVIIDYNVYGTGEYTLLFVHGWCINQTYWSNQIEALKSGYRIVTLDLPGFGKSGKNRDNWTIENYGQDINTVIDDLKLTNVILIGHSMGGDIILEAALKNKEVVALVGIDNFKDVGTEFNENVKAEIEGFVGMLKNNFSEIAPMYAEGSRFHASTDSLVKVRVI